MILMRTSAITKSIVSEATGEHGESPNLRSSTNFSVMLTNANTELRRKKTVSPNLAYGEFFTAKPLPSKCSHHGLSSLPCLLCFRCCE